MKYIVRKAYWNYEKEEQWLNDMCAQGYALTDYSWCRYVFEACEPGEYIYRIERLEYSPSHLQCRRYLGFMEESGVEPVATYMRWVFFRKKAADGPFDIYSDIDSRLRHYSNINAFWLALSILEFFCGLVSVAVGIIPSMLTPTYVPYFNIVACCLLFFASAQFFILGRGLRKKIRALKKEKRLRE